MAKQSEGDQNDHENFMVLSSTAKLNEVSEFYTKKLKEDGWTLNANTNMPQMVNISASVIANYGIVCAGCRMRLEIRC